MLPISMNELIQKKTNAIGIESINRPPTGIPAFHHKIKIPDLTQLRVMPYLQDNHGTRKVRDLVQITQ
jgi:hypothetical protein